MAPVGLTTGGQQTQQIPTTGIYYPIDDDTRKHFHTCRQRKACVNKLIWRDRQTLP